MRIADSGNTTTNRLLPLGAQRLAPNMGPVTVVLGTWHSAISPLKAGCKGTIMALVPESTREQ